MATTTARTPTIPRHTNLNPKPPTRINKVAKPPPRGDTPRFSLPGLASFTGTPQLPIPAISRDSLHRTTAAAGSNPRAHLTQQGMAPNSRKRVASAHDVLDLTHTTTADVDDSDSDEGAPSQKRSRTAQAGAVDPKRKSVKRAEQRAEKHDKLVAESAQWRTKYKKAFPSFTFYFDALDPLTEASLSKSVERLGAVSPRSTFCCRRARRDGELNRPLCTITVGRQLLQQEGHPCCHDSTDPLGRQWQGEPALAFGFGVGVGFIRFSFDSSSRRDARLDSRSFTDEEAVDA